MVMQRPRHLTVSSLSLVIYVTKSLCLDLCLGLLLKHMRTTALGLGCKNEHVLALMMA